MRPDQILRSAFLDNLGTDWIAVNHQGTVIGRASTEAGVRRANPDAEAFFSAADLDPAPIAVAPDGYEEGSWTPAPFVEAPTADFTPEKAPLVLDPDGNPPSDMAPIEAPVEEVTGLVIDWAPAERPVEGIPSTIVDGSAFDHDGDGKPGGSMPKSRKRKPASK